MSVATLTHREIEPQLAHILERYREDMERVPRPIAFYTEATWSGSTDLDVKGVLFRVAEARTVLQLREVLIRRPGDRVPVILTSLDDQSLPQDSRARLLRFRLFPVDAWEAVKSLFQASSIDPRLRERVVAEALLQNAPPDGYPPVPAGMLDADSAWRALYRAALGMGTRAPEARDLLHWASTPEARHRYVEALEPFRKAVRDHFVSRLGRVAQLVFKVLDAGKGQDILEFALVCDLLERAWNVEPRLAELVAARAEHLVGNRPLTQEDVGAMARAVRAHLEEAGASNSELSRANNFDSLVQSLRAAELAHLSPYSPMGFEDRLQRLGEALVNRDVPLQEVWAHFEAVRSHRMISGQELLLERCRMLVRLVSWLREQPLPPSGSLLDLARNYLGELAWVDRARELLAPADVGGPLQSAARQVLAEVYTWRAGFNRAFAKRLAVEGEMEAWSSDVLPIERVLEQIVAPQAKAAPVLLIVLDGMSWPVALVLAKDLTMVGWEVLGQDGSSPPIVLATVPTVTEFSRASLLAGELQSGFGAREKQSFRDYAPLQAVSRPNAHPRLFHKDELSEDGRGGLSSVVRDALVNPAQRVVAVVVNAIDDRLKGPQQTDSRWSLDAITPLRSLLEAAHEAGRRVILTADHGHVWEDASSKLPVAAVANGDSPLTTSERWRGAGGPIQEGEVRMAGARVKALTGLGEVVVPWSERIRYTLPKAGYHGGVTPQEVLVPLLLALPMGEDAEGLKPLELLSPQWWEPDGQALPASRPVGTVPGTRSAPLRPQSRQTGKEKGAESSRLPVPNLEPGSVRKEAVQPALSLLERLLDSEVLKAQSALAGRHVPDAKLLGDLLGPLIDQGGRVPVRQMAAGLKKPEHRVYGVVAQVARVLNVDGYPILTLDRGENLIRLDLEQLRLQFELKGD